MSRALSHISFVCVKLFRVLVASLLSKRITQRSETAVDGIASSFRTACFLTHSSFKFNKGSKCGCCCFA